MQVRLVGVLCSLLYSAYCISGLLNHKKAKKHGIPAQPTNLNIHETANLLANVLNRIIKRIISRTTTYLNAKVGQIGRPIENAEGLPLICRSAKMQDLI